MLKQFTTLLVLGLLFLPIEDMQAQESTPNEDELEDIINTISRVQNQITSTRNQRSTVQDDLENTEIAIVDLNRQILSIETNIEAEEAQLNILQQQISELSESKDNQQALIGQYLVSAYKLGQDEYLQLLLSQQHIDQSARTLKYYDYFNAARAEKVSTYNSTIADLSEAQVKVELTTASLQNNRLALNTQQQTLASSQTERQTLLQALDSELAQSGAELSRLEQKRAEIELLLEELARSIAEQTLNNQQPFEDLKGNMPWPSSGRLLNSFGSSYGLGDLDYEGVTIEGSEGDSVQAIHHGRVIFAEWFSNSGLLLIIDHGDGYMTLYAHNQLLYKNVGDIVASGEIIAAIGNTGGRNEQGVYFEIRYNGRSLDPINWCVSRN